MMNINQCSYPGGRGDLLSKTIMLLRPAYVHMYNCETKQQMTDNQISGGYKILIADFPDNIFTAVSFVSILIYGIKINYGYIY
jgi:hypothetical protein